MRVHSVVQPAPVSLRGLPGAENYRAEARQRLGDGVDERTLELGALQLYENTILATAGSPGPAPKVHPQVFQATRSLESVAGYTAGLVGGGLGRQRWPRWLVFSRLCCGSRAPKNPA